MTQASASFGVRMSTAGRGQAVDLRHEVHIETAGILD
jgi:hypothetical protein